jgi:predicted nucleotide-binding protein
MKMRFEGADGKPRLISALEAQKVCKSNPKLGSILADSVVLSQLEAGELLISEGASDNDVYFILTGKFLILVKGVSVNVRGPTDCVGEMSAINPTLPRSASVVASEQSVVAKISEKRFIEIADNNPSLWRYIAAELAARLYQRNDLIIKPNDKPKLFVISSVEALSIAHEIQVLLQHDVFVQVWTQGVFFASDYALEALEEAVAISDFAIAIAQPDDTLNSRGTESKVARDNVIFELGLFMGRLGRKRSILFQPADKELKLPSDLKGLTAVSYRTGKPEELPVLLGPACTEVRKLIKLMGVKK